MNPSDAPPTEEEPGSTESSLEGQLHHRQTSQPPPAPKGEHRRRRRNALEIISLIIGMVALLVGAYDVAEVRHVRKAISTQYLGEFPIFLPTIREVVNSARYDLVIVCDFPGYADFSDPDNSLKYLQAVRTRQSDKKLRIEFTCLDAQRRSEYLETQLPAKDWNEWTKDKQAQVDEFLWSNGHGPPAKPVRTRPELLAVMASVDEAVLRETFLNKANQTSQYIPIYFWVADCRRAVFSIVTPAANGIEHGFVTSDRSLIKALLELRTRYVSPAAAASLRQPCGR